MYMYSYTMVAVSLPAPPFAVRYHKCNFMHSMCSLSVYMGVLVVVVVNSFTLFFILFVFVAVAIVAVTAIYTHVYVTKARRMDFVQSFIIENSYTFTHIMCV